MNQHLTLRHAAMADLPALTAVEAACFPPAEAATREDFARRLAARCCADWTPSSRMRPALRYTSRRPRWTAWRWARARCWTTLSWWAASRTNSVICEDLGKPRPHPCGRTVCAPTKIIKSRPGSTPVLPGRLRCLGFRQYRTRKKYDFCAKYLLTFPLVVL